MSRGTCTMDGCPKREHSRGYCSTHYQRWRLTGTAEGQPCRTCGTPINRGPGPHVYCSEECRPECTFDGCRNPRRGKSELCNMHYAQSLRVDELKPCAWSLEWVCVVCGSEVPKRSGMRKYCSGSCHRLGVKAPDRPKSYDCVRCGLTVSLIVSVGDYGKFKRSDARLCASCKKRPRWAALSVRELANRDGTDCGICGFEVDLAADSADDLRPSIDHIIPRCHGGSDDAENLALTHLWCNLTKNWRKDQPSPLGPARLRYITEKVKRV